MRCLLVEVNDRKIVIDCGLGNKQNSKFMAHYGPTRQVSIADAVVAAGWQPEQITDVVLTHLHFDHCGGATERVGNIDEIRVVFPEATYWVSARQLSWAYPNPNAREKASFLRENIEPLMHSGQLQEVADGQNAAGLNCLHVYGHTEGMMLPLLTLDDRPLLYCADLLPSVAHLPLPWVMAYDVRPLQTLTEKAEILEQALRSNWLLFYEHDPLYAMSGLNRNDKGVIIAEQPSANLLIPN
jgi:glyoxylase-like metal-dependent hydrolase (beta-lactamase superfamily II)